MKKKASHDAIKSLHLASKNHSIFMLKNLLLKYQYTLITLTKAYRTACGYKNNIDSNIVRIFIKELYNGKNLNNRYDYSKCYTYNTIRAITLEVMTHYCKFNDYKSLQEILNIMEERGYLDRKCMINNHKFIPIYNIYSFLNSYEAYSVDGLNYLELCKYLIEKRYVDVSKFLYEPMTNLIGEIWSIQHADRYYKCLQIIKDIFCKLLKNNIKEVPENFHGRQFYMDSIINFINSNSHEDKENLVKIKINIIFLIAIFNNIKDFDVMIINAFNYKVYQSLIFRKFINPKLIHAMRHIIEFKKINNMNYINQSKNILVLS